MVLLQEGRGVLNGKGIRVIFPMAKARGFSPPAWSWQTSYLLGVLGNYWVRQAPSYVQPPRGPRMVDAGTGCSRQRPHTRSGVQVHAAAADPTRVQRPCEHLYSRTQSAWRQGATHPLPSGRGPLAPIR